MQKCLPLYFALTNSKILTDNGVALSQIELMKFWNFVNMLIGSRYSTIIMRGESDSNLQYQYNFDTKTPELLAKCIFMVGEKGRICWSVKNFINPDDTSNENFRLICEMLNQSIKEGLNKGNENRKQKIQDFYSRNRRFCEAFDGIDSLIGIYEKLKLDDRKKVNLYYLSLLHSINGYKYKKASSFVSSTTNPEIANQFTSDATIYGWLPRRRSQNRMGETSQLIQYIITENKSIVKEFNLPFCDTPVYPEQKEISLRCGILPHFIIGFKVSEKFYVNPAIFNSMDKMYDVSSFRKLCAFKRDLMFDGLDVDQTNFEEFCRTTNFKRYFTYDGYKYELYDLYPS